MYDDCEPPTAAVAVGCKSTHRFNEANLSPGATHLPLPYRLNLFNDIRWAHSSALLGHPFRDNIRAEHPPVLM